MWLKKSEFKQYTYAEVYKTKPKSKWLSLIQHTRGLRIGCVTGNPLSVKLGPECY